VRACGGNRQAGVSDAGTTEAADRAASAVRFLSGVGWPDQTPLQRGAAI